MSTDGCRARASSICSRRIRTRSAAARTRPATVFPATASGWSVGSSAGSGGSGGMPPVRRPGRSSCRNRSSGTCWQLADVARHLEEGVETGALARAEAVAELLEVAGEEAGGVAVALARLVREPLGLGAGEPHRGDERLLQLEEALDDAARAPPRRRTPSAAPSARARAGRGRGAASDPRTRSRSAASPIRSFASAFAASSSGSELRPREQHPRQHDRRRALRRHGDRAHAARAGSASRAGSSRPRPRTRRRGAASAGARDALRAYSIDEIGATSISPASSMPVELGRDADHLVDLVRQPVEDRRHVDVRDAAEPDHRGQDATRRTNVTRLPSRSTVTNSRVPKRSKPSARGRTRPTPRHRTGSAGIARVDFDIGQRSLATHRQRWSDPTRCGAIPCRPWGSSRRPRGRRSSSR